MYSFSSSTLFSTIFSFSRPPLLPPPPDCAWDEAGAPPPMGVFWTFPSAPYEHCFCSCFLTSPFRLI